MQRQLHQYVGRIVRLNNRAFQEIRNQAIRSGVALENSFIVARVSGKLKKLVCYGAGFRIVIAPSQVALV